MLLTPRKVEVLFIAPLHSAVDPQDVLIAVVEVCDGATDLSLFAEPAKDTDGGIDCVAAACYLGTKPKRLFLMERSH